jgi:hypothetical protein
MAGISKVGGLKRTTEVEAAEHGFDSCAEFPRPKGFREVVVRSRIEAHQGVDLLVPRGNHDDVGVAERPDLPGHLEAVNSRQADVESCQDRVVLADCRDPLESGPSGIAGESAWARIASKGADIGSSSMTTATRREPAGMPYVPIAAADLVITRLALKNASGSMRGVLRQFRKLAVIIQPPATEFLSSISADLSR